MQLLQSRVYFAPYSYSVRVITILENSEALYDVLNAQ